MHQQSSTLETSWLKHLQTAFEQDYMLQLSAFLCQEKANNQIVHPNEGAIFNALNTTPLSQVKVVILGQDPYHGAGQAHGLSFSVPKDIKIPPSLRNIYKEIQSDLNINPPSHGYLHHWAQQGVLLLNSVLTVRDSQATSHQGKGWETFTDTVINLVNQHKQNVVFLLWGNYAQKKGHMIDRQRHLVLNAPHPSPLSAHRGFLGCQHFSQANNYLQQHNTKPIDWSIPK